MYYVKERFQPIHHSPHVSNDRSNVANGSISKYFQNFEQK